jgi:hypothetical protein
MLNSLIFAFSYKNLISAKAFFYLINGGKLPPLTFNKVQVYCTGSYYIESYLNYENKVRYRVYDSYFSRPVDKYDLAILAIKRFKQGFYESTEQFYLETLEGLAKYYG